MPRVRIVHRSEICEVVREIINLLQDFERDCPAKTGKAATRCPSDIFIALDMEFTGFAQGCKEPNLQQRYAALRKTAKDFGICELGIAVFMKGKETCGRASYTHHIFTILMWKQGLIEAQSSSLEFLADKGFSVDDQIRHGVRYTTDHISKSPYDGTSNEHLFKLFTTLFEYPVVVHNGFLDLMLLYQSSYGEIPEALSVVQADFADMFERHGIWDTKYIVENVDRLQITHLQWLYYTQCRASDAYEENGKQILMEKLSVTSPRPRKRARTVKDNLEIPERFCSNFVNLGFCSGRISEKGTCLKSHDLTELFEQEAERLKVTAERLHGFSSNGIALKSTCDGGHQSAHSAGYDAYMTGVVFIGCCERHEPNMLIRHARNKMYLMGKDQPLKFLKSPMTSVSRTRRQWNKRRHQWGGKE